MIDHLNVIDGKKVAKELLGSLAHKVQLIKDIYNKVPALAIILAQDDYASRIYVNNKIKAAKNVGIRTSIIELNSQMKTEDFTSIIDKLNNDSSISGIIAQLPLPSHIDKNEILFAINPNKDIDGFHPLNVGYLNSGINKGFVPCTALGVLKLIEKHQQDLIGKNIVIISRSQIVGRPLAALLIKKHATVTICHSYTKNLQNITKRADIVVTAIGKPNFFTADFFNPNAIIIDVGISRVGINQITGDVDFINVQKKVKYISPVPGGVGPMTVAYLLINCFQAFILQHKILPYE